MGAITTLFHENGLGSVVRELWKAEAINPPRGLNNRGVWAWLNRVDVAMSLAIALVPDVRLLIVATAAMSAHAARFLGGATAESLQRAQLVAYGLEEGAWRACLVSLNAENAATLQRPRTFRGPGQEGYQAPSWQLDARAAANTVSNATHLLSERAPQQQIRQVLFEGAKYAQKALEAKLREVDGTDPHTARYVSNHLLLDELRKVVNPGVFSAVCLWSRSE